MIPPTKDRRQQRAHNRPRPRMREPASPPLSLDLLIPEASRRMIVDETRGLHIRIADRRTELLFSGTRGIKRPGIVSK